MFVLWQIECWIRCIINLLRNAFMFPLFFYLFFFTSCLDWFLSQLKNVGKESVSLDNKTDWPPNGAIKFSHPSPCNMHHVCYPIFFPYFVFCYILYIYIYILCLLFICTCSCVPSYLSEPTFTFFLNLGFMCCKFVTVWIVWNQMIPSKYVF